MMDFWSPAAFNQHGGSVHWYGDSLTTHSTDIICLNPWCFQLLNAENYLMLSWWIYSKKKLEDWIIMKGRAGRTSCLPDKRCRSEADARTSSPLGKLDHLELEGTEMMRRERKWCQMTLHVYVKWPLMAGAIKEGCWVFFSVPPVQNNVLEGGDNHHGLILNVCWEMRFLMRGQCSRPPTITAFFIFAFRAD